MRKTQFVAYLFAITALIAMPQAFAHHAIGGDTPTNFIQGLLSGLAHPVIGIDHLAFLVAMGVAAAITAHRVTAPLAFIATTVAGCLLVAAGIQLPLVEIGVAVSVILIGAMVTSGREYRAASYLSLFALAGIFHGSAYGGAILGAETNPLLAYLLGFAVIQLTIAVGVATITHRFSQTPRFEAVQPRLAGAVAAGVGVAILIENIETLLVT